MPNLLTNKLGPLPTWGWLGIATAGGVGFYLYEAHKNGSSGSSSGTTGSSTSSSNVPDYVFQNYNQIPPTSSGPTTPKPPVKQKGPAPISRVNRSKKVKGLEHKIYKTHKAYEKDKDKKTGAKKTTPKKAPRKTTPTKRTAARHTTTKAKK